jgi:hypothetical protein
MTKPEAKTEGQPLKGVEDGPTVEVSGDYRRVRYPGGECRTWMRRDRKWVKTPLRRLPVTEHQAPGRNVCHDLRKIGRRFVVLRKEEVR